MQRELVGSLLQPKAWFRKASFANYAGSDARRQLGEDEANMSGNLSSLLFPPGSACFLNQRGGRDWRGNFFGIGHCCAPHELGPLFLSGPKGKAPLRAL